VGGNAAGAVLWSRGSLTNLPGLPGSTDSVATGINDFGQAVGYSGFIGDTLYATEWSHGSVIDLGGLPGSTSSIADSINDFGQVVGWSHVGGTDVATEWSHGSVIDLGSPPGSAGGIADSINDFGQVAGWLIPEPEPEPPAAIPEPSTWAMMLLGFTGLGFAGYRRARAGHATLAA
jgi:probable HAF family extracellular repeat protein